MARHEAGGRRRRVGVWPGQQLPAERRPPAPAPPLSTRVRVVLVVVLVVAASAAVVLALRLGWWR